jgi:hypothetical protein
MGICSIDSKRAEHLGQCQRWRMCVPARYSDLLGATSSSLRRTQLIPNVERRLGLGIIVDMATPRYRSPTKLKPNTTFNSAASLFLSSAVNSSLHCITKKQSRQSNVRTISRLCDGATTGNADRGEVSHQGSGAIRIPARSLEDRLAAKVALGGAHHMFLSVIAWNALLRKGVGKSG